MELEEQNYATLSKYLMDTLNPDATIRKPGKILSFLRNIVAVNEQQFQSVLF